MHASQGAVRYLYAPFMILGLNGAAFYIVSQGLSYAWLAGILLLALGVAFIAERIVPVQEAWNHSHGDEKANVAHAFAYEISNINGVLLLPIIAWLVPWQGIWPHHWPLIAQVLTAIVIADLAFTLVHYWSHRFPLLWRLHAVHHGVPRMYGFNGLVRHPLHQALDMVVGTLPLALAGMSPQVAILLGFAVSIQLIVQHSNVDYALGPFRNAMSIGRIHHLHHVNWGKEGDCNFGLFTTLWDRMLGTFQPEPPRPITATDLGIDELPHFPRHSFVEQLMLPFVYNPGHGEPERYRQPPPSSSAAAAPLARRPTGDRLHPAE